MNEKTLKMCIGKQGVDGLVHPHFALDGVTPYNTNMVRVGVGEIDDNNRCFVALPNRTHKTDEKELKPFRDYVKTLAKGTSKVLTSTDKKS